MKMIYEVSMPGRGILGYVAATNGIDAMIEGSKRVERHVASSRADEVEGFTLTVKATGKYE
jgi:hypothetical protein